MNDIAHRSGNQEPEVIWDIVVLAEGFYLKRAQAETLFVLDKRDIEFSFVGEILLAPQDDCLGYFSREQRGIAQLGYKIGYGSDVVIVPMRDEHAQNTSLFSFQI